MVPLADVAEPELLESQPSPRRWACRGPTGRGRSTRSPTTSPTGPRCWCSTTANSSGRGQRARAGVACSLPERQVPADQPAAAPAQRRGRDRGPTAEPPRRGERGHPGGHHPLRGGQPVRGPRDFRMLRLRADPGQRTGRRRPVPRAGRHSAGHRAGCCPGPGDVTGGDLRQPHRTPAGPHHRLPGRRRPAPVAARLRRVVLPAVHRRWSKGSGRGRRCSPAASTWRLPRPSVRPTTCRPARFSTS